MLFFDGVCGLCNRFVDFMLQADRQHRFRFAPLQGETARRLLGMHNQAGGHEPGDPQAGDPRSFIFLDTDRQYEQSNAVLHALIRLGGAWRLIAVLYVFPRPQRDFIYHIVARNRYRWFGRRDACRMPTPKERDRFLP
ncbi:MAG: DUF393 domain-containing protein [Gemmatimonadetes bacterium]|nr:DUF393 domain-containing protein [Gemmatimonadota bacterium]MYG83692.1 DUF393 domain-containing protein [Gemmatimonadota bacterium]MYJ91065.1 DUF393 domain-containing protein [Gemmatimonadota bacterium]